MKYFDKEGSILLRSKTGDYPFEVYRGGGKWELYKGEWEHISTVTEGQKNALTKEWDESAGKKKTVAA